MATRPDELRKAAAAARGGPDLGRSLETHFLSKLEYLNAIGIALSFLIYKQFGGVIYFAFSLPWWAIAACVLGILAIVFATMMVSGAMIRNDNIVDTLKEENL